MVLQANGIGHAKAILVAVFVPVYLSISMVAKAKAWLSIMLSCFYGNVSAYDGADGHSADAGIMNAVWCLAVKSYSVWEWYGGP